MAILQAKFIWITLFMIGVWTEFYGVFSNFGDCYLKLLFGVCCNGSVGVYRGTRPTPVVDAWSAWGSSRGTSRIITKARSYT